MAINRILNYSKVAVTEQWQNKRWSIFFGYEDRDHEVSRISGLVAAGYEIMQTGGLLKGSGWLTSFQDDNFDDVGTLPL